MAAEVAAEEVGALARIVAARLPHGPRIEFVEDVIRRTPLAAVELEAVLEEAVAAQKAELDARVEAARKRKEKEDAAEAALKRVAELFAERRRNRLDALRREFEIEGGKPSELREAKEAEPRPVVKPESTSAVSAEPKTEDEKDFRRDVADQLTAAWRDACDAGKDEGREYLEAAIWKHSRHEATRRGGASGHLRRVAPREQGLAVTGDAARVVRPGWSLSIDDENYVPLKALVEKA